MRRTLINMTKPKTIHDEIKRLEKQQQEIFVRASTGGDDKLALAATSEQLKSKTIRAKIEGEMAPIQIEIKARSHFDSAEVFDSLSDREFIDAVFKECISRMNRINPTEDEMQFGEVMNAYLIQPMLI